MSDNEEAPEIKIEEPEPEPKTKPKRTRVMTQEALYESKKKKKN